ncbi:DNA-deoxyinosine glycosylase [Sphingomonas rosea]|uniref:DNA-deoxyinosine glycosylase n=1 Tax=Sphingomonas rosea TaxID=335605 RepID=A0ABP7THM0_9SPHN
MNGTRKLGLAPVARADARLLLLGSLPGEASLKAERYYAHPQNQFWRLLGEVIGEPLAALDHDARLETLLDRRIALWDVVHAARREGSLDQRMAKIEVRDLAGFVAGLPGLRAIGFNGATAAKLGRKKLGATHLALVNLPSSSPAHTTAFGDKLSRWRALAPFLD